MTTDTQHVLSDHVREEIDHWVAKFPEGRQRSAIIAALQAAQHENQGFLTPEIMDAVAAYLDLPPIQVYEVATFYSMFETEPVGRHSISVCTNISCMLRGAYDVLAALESKLGVKKGGTSGNFTIVEEECIAACANAPAVLCGTKYFLDVEPDKVGDLIAELEQRSRPESEVV